jgi:hypothetical protein
MSRFDGLVELFHFRSTAGPHQPPQTSAWDRENIIEVRDAWDGKALPATKGDFGREPAYRSSHEGYYNGANRVKDGISGQNDHRSVPDW